MFGLLSLRRASSSIDLPSLGGRAELRDGRLRVAYRDRSKEGYVSVLVDVARAVLERAIEVAAEQQRDSCAHERVWNWVNARYESKVMSLQEGETVVAVILFVSGGYFAVQKADTSVWVVDAMDVLGEPEVGQSVILEGSQGGVTVGVAE